MQRLTISVRALLLALHIAIQKSSHLDEQFALPVCAHLPLRSAVETWASLQAAWLPHMFLISPGTDLFQTAVLACADWF